MSGIRRRIAVPILAAAVWGLRQARAAAWPERPVRLIVPFPPGGGVDLTGRLLAERMEPALGQPVVVENRAGAGGALGVEMAARGAPDGYTLCMTSGGNITVGPLVRATPYDPLALTHVARVSTSPLILICRPDFPARDLRGFVAHLRANPAAVRFASGGVGTATHLAGELLNQRLGVRMTHVPYRGTAPAVTDVIAGNADIFFSDVSAWQAIEQGGARLLAVSTAARWNRSPGTPPVAEAVPGFDVVNWYGVAAPPGLPAAVTDRLQAEIARAVEAPPVRERLAATGFDIGFLPPAGFADFLRGEVALWRGVVAAANIRAD